MKDLGTVHLKHEDFSNEGAGKVHLLLRADLARVSYVLVNLESNSILELYDTYLHADTAFDLKGFLSSRNLAKPFAGIKVSLISKKFTLIPAAYFTAANIREYENIIQATETTRTLQHSIGPEKIHCISAIQQQGILENGELPGNIAYYSQAEPFIEACLTLPAGLGLQLNHDSFEACITSDGKLVFYTIFDISNADDFNYFLLAIIQQFQLVPESMVFVAGHIESGDEIYQRIAQYFNSIEFLKTSKIYTFPAGMDDLSDHQYYSLLALSLCE